MSDVHIYYSISLEIRYDTRAYARHLSDTCLTYGKILEYKILNKSCLILSNLVFSFSKWQQEMK